MRLCNPYQPVITDSGKLDFTPGIPKGFEPIKPAHERPWVGSYFEVPEPGYEVEPFKPQFLEFEIHILRNDLSTRVYTMTGFGDGAGNDTIMMCLRQLAYRDPEALAYAFYVARQDKGTGEFKRDRLPSCTSMRISERQWRWQSAVEEHCTAYTPSCYKEGSMNNY